MEVLLRNEHLLHLVVQVEEALEVPEAVGLAQGLDGRERQSHTVFRESAILGK